MPPEPTTATVEERFTQWEPETPFQEVGSFELGWAGEEPGAGRGADAHGGEMARPQVLETPFVGDPGAGDGRVADPSGEALAEFLFEAYDAEFEEALGELAQEASALAVDGAGELGDAEAPDGAVERLAETWLEPLRQEAEALTDRMAAALAQQDPMAMGEEELEALLDSVPPSERQLEPLFENFLGKLRTKLGKVVKGAVSIAKRGLDVAGRLLPINAILGRIKQLVRPLLERVLQYGLNRLPAPLRPLASQLAGRLLGRVGMGQPTDSGASAVQDASAAVGDVASAQHELDILTAELLFAADAEEQETLLEQAELERPTPDTSTAELDAARARFVAEITALEQGQDPTPALENFLPAVLPLVRTAIGIIGRDRLKKFLAGFLAKLIGRFVPADAASPLATAMVEAGLGLLSLEAPGPEARAHAAANAIAFTVEDTVRRLAEYDEETLADELELEAATLEAFQDAAAANVPPALLKEEVRPTSDVSGTWVPMPPPARPRVRYQKYTQTFPVTVTPEMARAVKTFGGGTLEGFLREQLGATFPVKARVHLFRAVQGTTLSRIAALERVPGLRSRSARAYNQIHPLTPEAAAMIQQPGLARPVDPRFLERRDLIDVGQCFYFLELDRPPAPVRPPTPPDGGDRLPRTSEVNATIDLRSSAIRIAIFLGEGPAQGVAAKLRGGVSPAGAWSLIKNTVVAGVETALSGDLRRHVTIRHEVLHEKHLAAPAAAAGAWLLRTLGQEVVKQLIAAVVKWVGSAILKYLDRRAQEFTAATESPADGVTIVVSLVNVPGLGVLRRIANGESVSPLSLGGIFTGFPEASVEIFAGFRRD